MKAWLSLREGVHYRRDAFAAGLEASGYRVIHGLTHNPGPHDVLVIWNRYRENAVAASRFEMCGRPVLVAENGYLGNDFAGSRWYALSRNQHNGAGTWPEGDAARWDDLASELAPWRQAGEVVILPQRGVGPPGVAMPPDWAEVTRDKLRAKGIKCRVRPHPGTREAIPLEVDLANAGAVVTWGSGAAVKALAWGIPAFYSFPQWIAAGAALPVPELVQGRFKRDDAARLATFRRLAWAQWRLDEIRTGKAFEWLLKN